MKHNETQPKTNNLLIPGSSASLASKKLSEYPDVREDGDVLCSDRREMSNPTAMQQCKYNGHGMCEGNSSLAVLMLHYRIRPIGDHTGDMSEGRC